MFKDRELNRKKSFLKKGAGVVGGVLGPGVVATGMIVSLFENALVEEDIYGGFILKSGARMMGLAEEDLEKSD